MNRPAILARCRRVLWGHGPQKLADILSELASAVGPDEAADFYGSGPLIEDFERDVALLLGKARGLFMPSGTMAQQIALRIWSEDTGHRRVGFHPTSHLALHEQNAVSELHHLDPVLVGHKEELITLEHLNALSEPLAALLIELPQREIGGQLPSWDDLQSQLEWARGRNIKTHLDGARLWESGPHFKKSYSEICEGFDSVYVSFYKGLGGIAGAVLAGSEEFIARARVWQRRHGGNLVHLYPYVVSARRVLKQRLGQFGRYREKAREVARALNAIDGIETTPRVPQSNMMHVFLRAPAERVMDASLRIATERSVGLFPSVKATSLPDLCKFELSIGDAAFELSADDITGLFSELMEQSTR